jgi:lipoic acid synthetase
MLRDLRLATVCQSARCPNLGECFACGTATFMILGRTCTRACTFCAVPGGTPEAVDSDEPRRVAEAAARLGLEHVVVTSVTRDDLPDGGSAQFAATIRAIHKLTGAAVEVLTPDFLGRRADVEHVLDASPEVFNHNVETVPRLYAQVRPRADFRRSLDVLAVAACHPSAPLTKSGMMTGLGESEQELLDAMGDLHAAGCRVLTLGQYLAPSPEHHPVAEFVTPERFAYYRQEALTMGFDAVASGPFVRSSYGAAELAAEALAARPCGDHSRNDGN